MILVIAEKPSVAQSIAKVLGATSRKDGYLEGNNYIVSWCVGHLVGLADASSPVPVELEKIEGGAHGYYHLVDKRIAIDEGMSEMQTIKTLIHEIAHAKLHATTPDEKTAPEDR